jgi:Family of unknown function (DUF5367)
MRRLLLVGFLVWLIGTALIRWALPRLPAPEQTLPILALYAASFGAVFVVVRRGLTRSLEPSAARGAAIALLLPTLILDAFASAFFSTVYPNLPADVAGVFAGWMMMCCAGGLVAVLKGK